MQQGRPYGPWVERLSRNFPKIATPVNNPAERPLAASVRLLCSHSPRQLLVLMPSSHSLRQSLTILLVTVALFQTNGETLDLIPVADTSLFQIGPDNNMGANTSGVIGTTEGGDPGRMLVRFDLESKIPTNAILKSASLTLRATKVRNASSLPVAMHRMQVAWVEGTGGNGSPTGAGEQAANGETTWTHRSHPDVAWSASGAAAPVDFLEDPSGTSTANGVAAFTFDSNPNLLSDLTHWIQNPALNFGWILLAPGTPAPGSAKRIGTRESLDDAPVLHVEFDMPKPAEPLVVTIPPVADTSLFEQDPDHNFGIATQLRVGRTQSKRARVLLRFDLPAVLPPTAVITNATLSITVIQAPANGGAASRLELFPMLRPWNEGAKDDSLASAGEPSWFVNASPDTFWGNPGGDPGVDFSPVSLTSTAVDGPSIYVFPSSVGFVQQLQQWLNFPTGNFGCLMASDQESTPQTARGLASRESETGKPELRIGYFLLAAGETPELIGVRSADGKLLFQVHAAPRIEAVLEHSPSLTSAAWSEVTRIVGNATGTTFEVEVPSPSISAFYRLRASGRREP